MSKLNPISEERKKERRDAVIKELKALIFPLVLTAIFAALIVFIMNYQNTGEEERVIDRRGYEGTDEAIVMENDYLKFVMDPLTTNFDVTVKSSGKVWHSVPVDGANDSKAIEEEKNKLQSSFILTYSNDAALDTNLDSFSMSAKKGIYEIETGDDFIKVNYTLGKISREYLFPPAIKQARFDEILSTMTKQDSESVKGRYKLLDINNLSKSDAKNKEQLLLDYPSLETDILYVLRNPEKLKESHKKQLESQFEAAGYTYEEYQEDQLLCGKEIGENVPVFNISVIYRLDGDDFTVEVPFDEFDCSDVYPVSAINPLPYFGSGSVNEEGYMLVPEGGGSIINFNNGKSAQSVYYANMYGWDYALERAAVVHNTIATMNCFGISEGSDSFICILEDGSSYASVKADISGRTSSYNSVNAIYTIKPREKYDLGANANQDMYVYLEELPAGEMIKQRYSFVDSGSYVDMAKDYGNYMKNKYDGYLTKKDDTSTPVSIEVLGAVDKVKQIVGVPVSRPLPITTYDEAAELLQMFNDSGIDNLSVKMLGWCNGGVQQKFAKNVKPISSLGGKKDLKNLSAKASELGIDLYLDGITSYAMNSTIFNGFFSFTDAAKFISRKRAELYKYSAVTYAQRENFKDYFLLHGDLVMETSENFAKECAKYNAGVSYQEIGKDLASDFYRKKYYSREQALNDQSQMLKNIKDSGQNVMINEGNAYALPYADMITNVDLKGSEYTILDATVPFLEIALHGYVNYTGLPINICGHDVEEILASAEYGAGLSFTVMKESPFSLQKTLYTEYYASDIESCYDNLLAVYNRYNSELGHTFNQEIIDHEDLSENVAVTTYEDGTKVYVNYGFNDENANGVVVPARDYLVVR